MSEILKCETMKSQVAAFNSPEVEMEEELNPITAAAARLRQSRLRLVETRHSLTISVLKEARLALRDSNISNRHKWRLITELCDRVRGEQRAQWDGQRDKLRALRAEVELAKERLAELVT